MRDYDILVRVELDGGNTTHEERRELDNTDDSSDDVEFADALAACLKGAGVSRLTKLAARLAITVGRSFDVASGGNPFLAAVSGAESAFVDAAYEYLDAVYQYREDNAARRGVSLAKREAEERRK